MKQITLILFFLITFFAFGQTKTTKFQKSEPYIVTKSTSGTKLFIPILEGWIVMDENAAKDLHPPNKSNVITFLQENDEGNHFSVYADTELSKLQMSKAQLAQLKVMVGKDFPSLKQEIENSPIPFDRIFEIIKKQYKNNISKYNILIANKDKFKKEAKLSLLPPQLIFDDKDGFLYCLPSKVIFHDFVYSIKLISGFTRLNRHIFMLQGAFDLINDNDVFIQTMKRFNERLITLNKSL